MKAEIIATGTELLLGETLNTSVYYLTGQLSALGIEVDYHITVGDNPERLEAVLREGLKRSDLIITTGGTGQTADDLTKDIVAKIFGVKLVPDQESLKRIRDFFTCRQAMLPERDKKQAYIPEGSLVLLNDWGTAPGALIKKDGRTVVILPGPPGEMQGMFERYVYPELVKMVDSDAERMHVRVLKVIGLEEKAVEETLQSLCLQENFSVTLLAKKAEIHVRLIVRKNDQEAQHILDLAEHEVKKRLEDRVFACDDQTMISVVAESLKKQGLTIATAESCTGGLVGGALTEVAGSSVFYLGGVVSYANQVKESLLGVKKQTLDSVGAVSSEVAVQMAEGIRNRLGVDLGLATTGIAGPDGGSAEKPVGLVYIALATPSGCVANKFQFLGDRSTVRQLTVQAALNMVRIYLEK